ncbi:nucleoside triphosphate pyrophosphohydrolase [Streptomyces sp. SAI-127]|uniref:nucleoside triphosphate pyrophosphohydrolase n=1 Tax=Streptomyces sp. SAI-127 TaxID=2940543 RepID=UPI002474832C|nr:nucleoside triphosphate pyrophosphohydrolase [Streptomyces sp. SAI-127]MDH6484444.1 putative house-cleaning noncanonical NTP pyrophosphatase (MazG superfamily) [Streptomyces sp. SAI-127]
MAEGKLVRDGIPEIIRASGAQPVLYTAGPAEYSARLRDKLREEVDEFLAAENSQQALEELADVLEVLRALSGDLGADWHVVESVRTAKAAERGSFDSRLVWLRNETAG